MTALARNRDTDRKGAGLVDIVGVPVAASTHIYQGSLVGVNSSGYLVPAASGLAGLHIAGRANAEANNASGAAAALTCPVERGAFWWANGASTSALTIADIGNVCYALDDQTVQRDSSRATLAIAGRVLDVDTNKGVLVETLGYQSHGDGAVDLLLPAAAVSLASKQFYAVTLDSSGLVIVGATAGADVLGVLQNAPAASGMAVVRVGGITQWVAGSTVTVGAQVASDASGTAKVAVQCTTDSSGASATAALVGSNVVGRALNTASVLAAANVTVRLTFQGAVPKTLA